MTWFKVDDTLAFHHKTAKAGNAAMGLWVRAGSWCAAHLTDGFVPEHMVQLLGTTAQASKLIKAGLWEEAEGGYVFHEWNEDGRQPRGTSVRESRKKSAERQAAWRANHKQKPQLSVVSNGVTDPLVTALVTQVSPLPRPDPTRPVEKKKTSSSSARGTRLPDDWQPSKALIDWWRTEFSHVDGKLETAKFRDFWHSKAGPGARKIDWDLTWKNWIRNATERSPASSRRRGPQVYVTADGMEIER